jgi:hypothetical protein
MYSVQTTTTWIWWTGETLPQNATITAMEENHVNEADVLQPAITERVAITEMETVVETENNFVGDEQQHINSHTTTEPCPAAVTEDGDE